MSSRHFHVGILGQGIAGTSLAWTWRMRGKRVCVIDRPNPSSASRVAAGLITPVTGPKLAVTWQWEACRSRAEQFYSTIQQQTGVDFFQTQPALHLLRNDMEKARFEQRIAAAEFQQLVCPPRKEIHPLDFSFPWGAFEMPRAAKLQVSRYLDASRDAFAQAEGYREGEVDCQAEIEVTQTAIRLPRWDLTFDRLFCCQGYVPEPHRWFAPVKFNPAKGEILTLEIPELHEQRVVHGGCWLAPEPDAASRNLPRYQAGSTFEWRKLTAVPTLDGRDQLLTQLATFLRRPCEVVGHFAAVRPTMHDFKPVIGLHPSEPRIGILNGLGTKGALMAPWLAELLVQHVEDNRPLPPELDVQRWFQ